tara:strand:+ start:60 stop:170 length:111 start_codon:yes stop_codon:yes gene_type:complete
VVVVETNQVITKMVVEVELVAIELLDMDQVHYKLPL